MVTETKKLEKMIDSLALSVAKGFSQVGKRFNDMDKRFNNLESDLKSFKIETRDGISELNEKMDNLTDVVMENHEKRIDALEEKVF